MEGMKEVTRKEFFEAIGKLDVHPHPEGKWPYTSYFKTPSGQVRGAIEDHLPEDSGLTKSRYHLPN